MNSSDSITAAQSTLQQREAEIYFRRNPDQFLEFFYKSYSLSEDFIERHQNHLDWRKLGDSKLVPWSEELIAKYAHQLNWKRFSIQPPVKISASLVSRCAGKWDWRLDTMGWLLNESVWPAVPEVGFKSEAFLRITKTEKDLRGPYPYLPLSTSLIDKFSQQWNWLGLSLSEALPWSEALIEHYKDRLFWGGQYKADDKNSPLVVEDGWETTTVDEINAGGLSDNRKLPWTKEFVERHKDRFDWWYLSRNTGLPWSTELIERYKKRWDWENLSANTALPWTVEFFESYADNWNWSNLSANPALPWSSSLIERYADKWEWERLVWNSEVRWSVDLVTQYKDQLEELYIPEINDCEDGDGFDVLIELGNVDWAEVSFDQLSGLEFLHFVSDNLDIPWTESLIAKYESEWNWYQLAINPSVPWTEALIERFKIQLYWNGLSQNQQLSWSINLLERYEDKWDWKWLSSNPSLPWSKALVNRFKDKWHWSLLAETNANRPEILQHSSKLMGKEFYQLYYSPTPIFRCAGEKSLSCFNLTRQQVEKLVTELSMAGK